MEDNFGPDSEFIQKDFYVEVKDNDHWYLAKILDLKIDERKILIHFQGWNKKYDQWVTYEKDTFRNANFEHKNQKFSVNDIVLAKNPMYGYIPAKIVEILSDNGSYVLSFIDKTTKTEKLTSIRKITHKKFNLKDYLVEIKVQAPTLPDKTPISLLEAIDSYQKDDNFATLYPNTDFVFLVQLKNILNQTTVNGRHDNAVSNLKRPNTPLESNSYTIPYSKKARSDNDSPNSERSFSSQSSQLSTILKQSTNSNKTPNQTNPEDMTESENQLKKRAKKASIKKASTRQDPILAAIERMKERKRLKLAQSSQNQEESDKIVLSIIQNNPNRLSLLNEKNVNQTIDVENSVKIDTISNTLSSHNTKNEKNSSSHEPIEKQSLINIGEQSKCKTTNDVTNLIPSFDTESSPPNINLDEKGQNENQTDRSNQENQMNDTSDNTTNISIDMDKSLPDDTSYITRTNIVVENLQAQTPEPASLNFPTKRITKKGIAILDPKIMSNTAVCAEHKESYIATNYSENISDYSDNINLDFSPKTHKGGGIKILHPKICSHSAITSRSEPQKKPITVHHEPKSVNAAKHNRPKIMFNKQAFFLKSSSVHRGKHRISSSGDEQILNKEKDPVSEMKTTVDLPSPQDLQESSTIAPDFVLEQPKRVESLAVHLDIPSTENHSNNVIHQNSNITRTNTLGSQISPLLKTTDLVEPLKFDSNKPLTISKKKASISTLVKHNTVESEKVPSRQSSLSPSTTTTSSIDIVHCACGMQEENGLMVQCDMCFAWQHSYCLNLPKDSHGKEKIPTYHICYFCRNPPDPTQLLDEFFVMNDVHRTGKFPMTGKPLKKGNKTDHMNVSNADKNNQKNTVNDANYISQQQNNLYQKSVAIEREVLNLDATLYNLRIKLQQANNKDCLTTSPNKSFQNGQNISENQKIDGGSLNFDMLNSFELQQIELDNHLKEVESKYLDLEKQFLSSEIPLQ